MSKTQDPAPVVVPMSITVELESPLKRGDLSIDSITLHRGTLNDARGLFLIPLAQMNVDEIRKLLPRISLESLIVEEVDRIDAADMMQIAFDLAEFLAKRDEVDAPAPVTPDARPMLLTVTLDVPIARGDAFINVITLRRPDSGELRGVSMAHLGQMSVDEILKILPRITMERLTPEEAGRIDLADGLAIGGEIGDFLLPKRLRAA